MNQQSKALYDSLCKASEAGLRIKGAQYYSELKEEFKKAIGWEGAYFATLRVACAFMAHDAILDMNEYMFFKEIANASPNFDELYASVRDIRRNIPGAINSAKCSQGVKNAALKLCLAFCAVRGSMSSYDTWAIEQLEN